MARTRDAGRDDLPHGELTPQQAAEVLDEFGMRPNVHALLVDRVGPKFADAIARMSRQVAPKIVKHKILERYRELPGCKAERQAMLIEEFPKVDPKIILDITDKGRI